MRNTVLVLAVALAGCETVSKETLQEIDYGPRPATWQKQINDLLLPRLPDAKAAQVTFQTQPKAQFQRETLLRDRHWGWAVCVHVYENHPEGAEDPYAVVYFFRGEKLVHVNGGPGDRNPIGSGYARSQCREMGAPPLAVASTKPRPQAAASGSATEPEGRFRVQRPQSPFPQ